MRVLVLGGTAWLGGLVAREADERGHVVTCLARGTSGDAPEHVELVRADRGEVGAYERVRGEHWDLVVDVARHPGHVRGAVAALEPVAKRYAFVSTGNVYADHSVVGADESAPLLEPLADDVMADMSVYGEAKVACEQAVLAAFGTDRSLLARAGLLGGPGDVSGRSGYWPVRFARPSTDDGTVLVPDVGSDASQLLDARDLAAWLVATDATGVYNATGDTTTFAAVIDAAREVAGHTGPLARAPEEWLRAHDVEPWMGPRSLPLWLGDPDYAGFAARSNAAARAAGLERRPLAETFADTLEWELAQGVDRPRSAGLTRADERELIDQFVHSTR